MKHCIALTAAAVALLLPARGQAQATARTDSMWNTSTESGRKAIENAQKEAHRLIDSVKTATLAQSKNHVDSAWVFERGYFVAVLRVHDVAVPKKGTAGTTRGKRGARTTREFSVIGAQYFLDRVPGTVGGEYFGLYTVPLIQAAQNRHELILVDGTRLDTNSAKPLDPNQITTLVQLNSTDAVRRYGADAKRGALVITTKAKPAG